MRKVVRPTMDDNYWDCSVCTYRNGAEAFKCAMCDVRKGTSTRYKRVAFEAIFMPANCGKRLDLCTEMI